MRSIDSATNNDFLNISRSMIPYLDADKQKGVAVFIKVVELMSTIDLFSKEEFVRSIARPRDSGWEKNFLNDLRSNLSDDRGYFIDAILKLSEFRDLLAVKNNDTSGEPHVNKSQQNPNMHVTPSQRPQSQNATPHGSPPPSMNPSDILDKLSGILEPNQLQILKVLSSFMK
ncbi:MAG: hypothetical protein K0R69_2047 [Clostridia bacterium]|nr:hypothetical protein [Clostridia bacterium]